MKRVKFKKGEQREFLKNVLGRTNCISLRELINRGFSVNYSTLKNYFNESRCLPEDLFKDLCFVAKIEEKDLDVEYLGENWGKVKGGKNIKKL